MYYRNCEGYWSPTEGEALAHIIHEERMKARAKRKKEYRLAWTNPRSTCKRRRGKKEVKHCE